MHSPFSSKKLIITSAHVVLVKPSILSTRKKYLLHVSKSYRTRVMDIVYVLLILIRYLLIEYIPFPKINYQTGFTFASNNFIYP